MPQNLRVNRANGKPSPVFIPLCAGSAFDRAVFVKQSQLLLYKNEIDHDSRLLYLAFWCCNNKHPACRAKCLNISSCNLYVDWYIGRQKLRNTSIIPL